MKTLTQRLDEYPALRRSMGFDLSFDERVSRFGDENGFQSISTPLFLDWKANYGSADNNTWAHRLGMVRKFAFWLAEHDDQTEVPSSLLVTGRYRRREPYIYVPVQLAGIVAEAGRLPSPYGLRGALWQTLFGLIAVTGMRVYEALSLERHDVDLVRALITLRNTKNGKDRQLPINNDTASRPAGYAKLRDRLVTQKSSMFFIKEDGEPAGDCGDPAFMTCGTHLPFTPFWIGSGMAGTSKPKCTSSAFTSAILSQSTRFGTSRQCPN